MFYLHTIKKIIPIFLFIIICITHLNIISAVVNFSARYDKELNKLVKKMPTEKEDESEKENKIKEKVEEQENVFFRDHFFATNNFQLSDKDKFVCTNTKLNIHPFNDDVLQPPKAV